MITKPQRTCPSCGNELSGATEFCPVCLLRKALAGGVKSGESSASEEAVNPTPEQAAQRFEHARNGSTGGTSLLRPRRTPVSFAWSSAPPLRGTYRSVALFPPDGKDYSNNADRRTSSLTGARTE